MNTHAIELSRAESLGIFTELALVGKSAIIKGKKPHPKNLKLSFKGATVNLSKTSHDETHSFYRGTLTANGNVKNVNFTITRDRDVVKHVMAMLEKAAK
jgi:hypothetical protein